MVNSFLIYLILVATATCVTCQDLDIIPRSAWGAREAKGVTNIISAVPYVVIHHSFHPEACNTSLECSDAMRWMQDFHQFNRSWWDIGYNFAACGDGKIYEGRGWGKVGAHALGYNNISVGICIIGDWRTSLPPAQQLDAVKQLIVKGVKEGLIAEDYHLVGHKQVREGTDCPGERLYEEIERWPHYDSSPDRTKLKMGRPEDPHPKATLSEDDKQRKGTGSLLNKLLH